MLYDYTIEKNVFIYYVIHVNIYLYKSYIIVCSEKIIVIRLITM